MRKDIIILFVLVSCTCRYEMINAQPFVWQQTGNQFSEYSQMVETDNGYLFVTDGQYMQTSVSDGSPGSWNPVNGYPQGSELYYNLVASGNTIFMVSANSYIWPGIYPRGIFASTDFGATWQENNKGLGADSANTDFIYVMANGALLLETGDIAHSYTLYRSTDGGNSWSPDGVLSGNTFGITSIIVKSATEAYMATADSGIFKSTDNGVSWIEFSYSPDVYLYHMISAGGKFYATSNVNDLGTFAQSVDDGATWSNIVPTGLPDSAAIDYLLATPSDTFYGANLNSPYGIYYSANNCLSWDSCNAGLPTDDYYIDGMYLSKKGYLFAFPDFDGIYRSSRTLGAAASGIENVSAAASAEVFPNPFSDYTTIKLNGITGTANVTIYDPLGNQIRKLNSTNGNEVRIDRQGLAPGIYFYTAVSNNQIQISGKLMVQ